MSSRKLKVFLCHSSGDKPAVRDLYKRLQTADFEPWLDEEDLLPGQDWEQEIPKAVRSSDAILVCLSRSSITKEGYVQKEIAVALDVAAEKPEGVIFLIPLKLEPCEMPERLKRWQACMLSEERGYERLLRSLNVRAGALDITVSSALAPSLSEHSPPAPIPPLVRNSESSLARPTIQLPSIRNSVGMDFVLIPAGEFHMGSENGRKGEKPVHLVRISRSFYLGKCPITQAQWQAVMRENPSHFISDPNRPVESISWYEAQAFLQQLGDQEIQSYRLPTEAEWEYAARAGATTAYCFGDDPGRLSDYGWYDRSSGKITHPVGRLKPNAWGLHDIHGNVWEWVQDWYDEAYYQGSPMDDPKGPEKTNSKVIRGGGWHNLPGSLRVSARLENDPSNRFDGVGFRIVMLPKLPLSHAVG